MCSPRSLLAEAIEVELAAEWQLFLAVETGASEGAWRIWEAPRPVVCVGRSGRVADELHEDRCAGDEVPVIRRETGGGAVVLAPGCLNYAVVLPLASQPELIDVAASYRLILGRLVRAIALPGLAIAGMTDLALAGRKVAGSAQRRGRRALLHHGTLLHDFDASLATRYLAEPARQPAYRARRSHADFLANLPRSTGELRATVAEMWDALRPGGRPSQRAPDEPRVSRLDRPS